MGAEKNIVAIELGSSSIRAIVGQKKADGSLQVLNFEKENAPDSIHRGVIYNLDKTSQAISSIKKRLEERGRFVIDRVCVGISGQSLRTMASSVSRHFDIKVTISDEMVDSLLDENRTHTYPGCEILDVVPQEYRVGNSPSYEPVGVMTDRIEGHYKNIVARKSLRENIQHCLKGAKLDVADYFISPLLLSNYILTDTEKRSGCALVDFGADTTTVAVYEKNILRHLVVIPLGGAHITNDIATSLHVEHDEAERLKLAHGSAYTDEEKLEDGRTIGISNERTTDLKSLLNLVEARQQEILANVWEQLKDYSDRLLAGVVFTGGASNMRELETAFVQYHHFDKVKTRLMPANTEFTTALKLDPQANTLATLVAMLRRGDQECTSERHTPADLFDQQTENDAPVGKPSEPAAGQGVVRDPKPAANDAEADTSATDEAGIPETPLEPEKPQEPKKPGAFKRLFKKVSDALEGLVEDNPKH